MGNVELVKDAYAAFGRGDIPTVVAAMDPQVEWYEAENNPYQMSGSAWIGPDAVTQNLFAKLAADWDSFTLHPQRFHDAGDSVVVEGRCTGTHKATGRAFDGQYCHIFGFRDAKLVRFQQYVDTAQLQHVVGLRQADAPVGAT